MMFDAALLVDLAQTSTPETLLEWSVGSSSLLLQIRNGYDGKPQVRLARQTNTASAFDVGNWQALTDRKSIVVEWVGDASKRTITEARLGLQ